MITVFKDYASTAPIYRSLGAVLSRIKGETTNTSKVKVDEIRRLVSIGDKKAADAIKSTLPCICFSGRFLQRNDKSLIQHSGLLILDFDKIQDPEDFRDEIFSQNDFVVAAFLSPSGNGVKVLCKIPPDKDRHRGFFTAISKRFQGIDPSGVNESRICFDSYDPDIRIRDNPTEFTDFVFQQEKVPSLRVAQTDFTKMGQCINVLRKAKVGERHTCLLKASRLAGGFISAGVIKREDAIEQLEREAMDIFGDEYNKVEQKAIFDGIEDGMKLPLHQIEPESTEKSDGDNGVVELSAVWDTMLHQFDNGKPRGETTHFEGFDNYYTHKRGELNIISGTPGSGKSIFYLQLALIKAVKDGWKWAVFSPEQYPASEFYDDLIEMMVGKPADPFFGANQMSKEEYMQAMKFVMNHFFYVYPDTDHKVADIEQNFLYLHKRYGIHGVIIDPINEIIHDMGAREDQYLSVFLKDRKRFAHSYNLCYTIIVHPRTIRRDKEGKFPVLHASDLSGGSMFWNKTDNLFVLHRPCALDANDPEFNRVDIHIQKIKKQKLVGRVGTCEFYYDPRKYRFYCNNRNPLENVPIQIEPSIMSIAKSNYHETNVQIISRFDPSFARDDDEPPF